MAVNEGISAGSVEEALSILRDFELRTHSRFCVYTFSKDFGHTSTFGDFENIFHCLSRKQKAIIHAEHFIRQKFLVEENRSMFNTVGSIRGLKEEGLIKAFATEQSMVSLYIGHVLVKEALCAAFQGITGIQFREADAELSVSEKKTKMQAITMAIECSLGKKKQLELKYN